MGGSPVRYGKAVAHALAYARALAAGIPGPLSIDREHFASAPTVHALFGSIEEVRAAITKNVSLPQG